MNQSVTTEAIEVIQRLTQTRTVASLMGRLPELEKLYEDKLRTLTLENSNLKSIVNSFKQQQEKDKFRIGQLESLVKSLEKPPTDKEKDLQSKIESANKDLEELSSEMSSLDWRNTELIRELEAERNVVGHIAYRLGIHDFSESPMRVDFLIEDILKMVQDAKP